jgi:hypothetical protein
MTLADVADSKGWCPSGWPIEQRTVNKHAIGACCEEMMGDVR